ncbi:MAG: hypothetical protein AAF525_08045 [Pseudomonadota bacterium]
MSTVDFTLENFNPPGAVPPTDIIPACLPAPCSIVSVDENATPGDIAALGVVDADQTGGHTFEVLSDPRFEVVGNVLRIVDGAAIDFESGASPLDLTLRVTDNDGNVYTEVLSVVVNDVNEAPNEIVLDNNFVPADEAGASIGLLQVTDPDVTTPDFIDGYWHFVL